MRIAMFLAAMFLAGASPAQDKAPSGSIEKGRKLYVDLNCHSCHGTHAQGGGRGAEPPIPLGYPWAGFLQQMRKPRQDMPAYEEKLVSNQDVADLYAYFASIRPAPAAKDIPLLRNF
jgi:mono/diheme cytochrome c family protein